MKPFTVVAVVLFLLVCVGHIIRLISGWDVIVNGWRVPQWVSAAGAVLGCAMTIMLWRESRRN